MTAVRMLGVVIGFLAVVEFLGLVSFVALYARSDWRSTAAGRTLMEYPAVLIVVFAVSALARFWPSVWLGTALVMCHVAFAFVVWRRVRVLIRYQRRGEETDDVEGS